MQKRINTMNNTMRLWLMTLLFCSAGLYSWGADFYRSTTTTANWNSGTAWNATTDCGAGGSSWPTTSADNVTINCASRTTNPSTTMACGNLIISNGTLELSSGTLTVWGNLTLSGGVLNISGGTLIIYGNFSKTGGTFSHTSGTINFGGTTSTQSITSNVYPLTFYNLTISGNQNRTMGGNVVISNDLTLTGGQLTPGNNTLTMNGAVNTGTGKIVLSTTSPYTSLSFGGASENHSNFGAMFQNTAPYTINNLTMTVNTCTLTLASSQSLTVNGAFTLTAGKFVIGSNTLTLNGAISGNINGSITGSSTSDMIIGGSGAASMYFDLSNFNAGGTNTIRNFTNNRTSNSFVMLSSLRIGGTLAQSSASSSVTITNASSTQTLTIDGSISGSGGFVGRSGFAHMQILGSGALGANLTFVTDQNLSSLTINRSGSPVIQLGSNLNISSSVVFDAISGRGSLDLNGYNLNLGTTGRILNESNNNRILCAVCTTSSNDSRVIASGRTLAANTTYDNTNTTNWDAIGRIGVYITTGSTAPGSTTISRGFYSRSGNALTSSVLRFFDITPTNNSNLNATLTFNYFDTELNSITESSLKLFRDGGTNNWMMKTPATLNISANTLTKAGISQFSPWTAGGDDCDSVDVIPGANPSVCSSASPVNAGLTYSAPIGTPGIYNIYNWSGGTFAEVSEASLPASPVLIAVPGGTSAGVYTANFYVANATTGCPGTLYTISVTVDSTPTIALGSNPFVCYSPSAQSASLTYTATTGSPDQYSLSSWSGGGFATVSNASFSSSPFTIAVPAAVAAGAYTANLTVRNSTTGCVSQNYSTGVTVNNIVPTVDNTTPASRCDAGTVDLGAVASQGTLNWFTGSTGGTAAGTGSPFTTPSISSTTVYFVEAAYNGCRSLSRTPVTATVNKTPAVLTTTPGSVCDAGSVSLGATASAGTLSWYDVASGGTALGTGNSYTTGSISTTTNYYVECSANGCTSGRSTVTASVVPSPVVSGYTTTSPASCYCSITLNGLSPNTPYTLTYNKDSAPVNAGVITTTAAGELIIGSLLPGAYDNIVVSSQGCSSDPTPSSGVITLN